MKPNSIRLKLHRDDLATIYRAIEDYLIKTESFQDNFKLTGFSRIATTVENRQHGTFYEVEIERDSDTGLCWLDISHEALKLKAPKEE